MLKTVVQEHSMGCSIACIACVAGIKYSKVLKMASHRLINGYCFCIDIVKILKKLGFIYDYTKVTPKTKKYLEREGTIVFIKRSAKYPLGHFLAKTNKGWMDPWINYPIIAPARAGFNNKLPGKPQWVVFRSEC